MKETNQINSFASIYLLVYYTLHTHVRKKGPSWSYGSWIYNYLCNHCTFYVSVKETNQIDSFASIYLLVYYTLHTHVRKKGPSWSYGSWIYNYLCNHCTWWGVLNTTLCDKVCRWFSLVSPTNKTDCHDITEILLKVALNTINLNQTVRMNLTWLKLALIHYTHLFSRWTLFCGFSLDISLHLKIKYAVCLHFNEFI